LAWPPSSPPTQLLTSGRAATASPSFSLLHIFFFFFHSLQPTANSSITAATNLTSSSHPHPVLGWTSFGLAQMSGPSLAHKKKDLLGRNRPNPTLS
jgi:hypothetical protein